MAEIQEYYLRLLLSAEIIYFLLRALQMSLIESMCRLYDCCCVFDYVSLSSPFCDKSQRKRREGVCMCVCVCARRAASWRLTELVGMTLLPLLFNGGAPELTGCAAAMGFGCNWVDRSLNFHIQRRDFGPSPTGCFLKPVCCPLTRGRMKPLLPRRAMSGLTRHPLWPGHVLILRPKNVSYRISNSSRILFGFLCA